MVDGNGRAGLTYVLKDMNDAAENMEDASARLKACKLPDFKACPAGGEEFHAAMAEMSHAQTDGISALLQWQTIQVKKEMERANGQRHDRATDHDDEPEIKTKWFTARGVAAMWPAAIVAIALVIYVIMMTKS
jgi:hypothetical protein